MNSWARVVSTVTGCIDSDWTVQLYRNALTRFMCTRSMCARMGVFKSTQQHHGRLCVKKLCSLSFVCLLTRYCCAYSTVSASNLHALVTSCMCSHLQCSKGKRRQSLHMSFAFSCSFSVVLCSRTFMSAVRACSFLA